MLDIATLALGTFMLTQLLKPLLHASFLPQDAAWSNTAQRAVVFGLAYLLTVGNALAASFPFAYPMLWSLLPKAGVVFGAALATYHLGDLDAITLTPGTPATPATPAPIILPPGQ